MVEKKVEDDSVTYVVEKKVEAFLLVLGEHDILLLEGHDRFLPVLEEHDILIDDELLARKKVTKIIHQAK